MGKKDSSYPWKDISGLVCEGITGILFPLRPFQISAGNISYSSNTFFLVVSVTFPLSLPTLPMPPLGRWDVPHA